MYYQQYNGRGYRPISGREPRKWTSYSAGFISIKTPDLFRNGKDHMPNKNF